MSTTDFIKSRSIPIVFVFTILILFVVGVTYSGSKIKSINSKDQLKILNQMRDCRTKDDREKEKCLNLVLTDLTRIPIDESMKSLSVFYQENLLPEDRCHSWAHRIGENAFELYPSGKDLPVNDEISICGYGFYHGYMGKLTEKKLDTKLMKNLCDKVKSLSSGNNKQVNNCYHGIGHGSMSYYSELDVTKEVSQEMLNKSLRICESVTDSKDYIVNCAIGVFHSFATYNNNLSFQFCDKQKDIYKPTCYGGIIPIIIKEANNDYLQAFQKLNDITNDDFAQAATIQFVSGYLYSKKYKNRYGELIAKCRKSHQVIHDACVKGAVVHIWEVSSSGSEFGKAESFCNTSDLELQEKEVCFELLVSQAKNTYSKDRVQEFCKEISQPYQKYCE